MGLPASKRWFLRTAFVFFQICFGGVEASIFVAGSEYGGSLEPLAASSTRFFSAVDKLLQRHILGNLPKTETNQIKDIYRNGIKINLGNAERFWMPDGDSVEKRGGRVRRSYVARYPSVDKYDLTAPVPIDYILVVDLGIQVKDLNETALRWLEIAFATNLSLPLENVVTQKVGYHGNTVEMFFVRYGRPVTTFSIEDLIPVKEIVSLKLLHTLQQTLPFLNITNIRPQQAILVTNEESEPLSSWFVSYFPYIAAACCVCIILMTTVLVYCCCCKKKKEPENDKGSQKLQQIYFPSVKPDMKDPKMIQPGGSPLYTPPGSITPVQTPTGRIKAKGLLERRGSNASLTIDLNASPESGRWDGTPPKESTGVEYLMTAGHRLSRQDLKNAVRNNRALHQEFWEIFTNHPEKVSVAGSGMKNRYRSMIPNEHSRVILPDSEWDPLSSYINANYIRGYECEPHTYIATQGPMSHTIVDFWRMIWYEKSPIIVMITKLKENNNIKCENYLPEDNSSCTFGDIEVKVEKVKVKQGYTVRYLSLKCDGEIIHVLHYWYTAWPDHKPPQSAKMLLELVKDVENKRLKLQPSKGPVVVHCSAGIGRTGCFIAITVGMRQLKEEHSVDILGIVCHMRIDRGGTIQTHEQYEFIHQALCEYEKELAEPEQTTVNGFPGD
ncbi:tyrosine-protein phosphatase non-receptor type 5-like isoform X3 [Mytilus trossulus]|uniref:tyrosine-protein phosphatase non-receptor type 5-like isoform X3 n=1 Tax=Mytilus trossulus TaxID=6551 RepID=UPI00300742D4